jgi:hypothetical protein
VFGLSQPRGDSQVNGAETPTAPAEDVMSNQSFHKKPAKKKYHN